MVLSHYQENILNHYQTTRDNIVVNACPGSGKTFTLDQLWQATDSKAAYLVFNKANAVEAEKKFNPKDNSFIGTLNSFGARSLYAARHGLKLNKNKVWYIVKDKYPFRGDKKGQYKQEDLHKLIMLAKANVVNSISDMQYVRDTNDIYGYPDICQHALEVYNISLEDRKSIDFADQLLLPVVFDLPKPSFKDALIDEAQDLSPVQAMLVDGIAERYVFVGDRRQAIYGFRGAASNSLDDLQQKFEAVALPLKLTYRCAKLIVGEAQKTYADDIEALPEAIDGVVRDVIKDKRMEENYRQNNNTLVVCRNNAPLVTMAYSLLRNKIPVQMIGRDFGSNLIGFIKRLDAASLSDLESKLDMWRYEQEAIATAQDHGDKLQSISDKYDTVLAFIAMCETGSIQELYDAIDSLFSADYGVKLSTIHRAKGLEAERVYILEPNLIPGSYAKSALQLEQENNLRYVAVTRAKSELVYLL